ncbi:MAG: hypothetical protein JWM95_665 [Gemmatimonadetes bacterium]|nr:hypothetical protein [Gemmatimonadota bacterium]
MISAKARRSICICQPRTRRWNVDALATSKEIILCESLIDAMTLLGRRVSASQLLGECGQLIRRLVAGLSMPDWPRGPDAPSRCR